MPRKISSAIHQPRLYEVVAERILKDHALTLRSGERLPTEREFSDLYQVSVPTVREALRSLVQAGYLHRRQGSGTYRAETPSAAPMKDGPRAAVAIVTPLDLTDGSLSCYFGQVLLETGKLLRKVGLDSQIYFGETAPASPRTFDDSQLCTDIVGGKISAVVVLADARRGASEYGTLLEKQGIPVLSGDLVFSSSGHSRLHDFLERSVDLLVARGRRKIACIAFGTIAGGTPEVDFRKIVARAGGVTDDSWIIDDFHPNLVGSGYSLMREIWTTGKIKPDGLILCDDVFFQDAAQAIRELGIKVPDQLIMISAKNKGVRLIAPFPVIELQFDSSTVANQLADNVVAVLGGREARPLVTDPVLFDPLAGAEEDSEETAASVLQSL